MEEKNKIITQIVDIESYALSNQENEDSYIKELNFLYNKLHKLYDTRSKRSHDSIEGKDYHIVECEGELIFKHKTSGFAPRLKQIK